MNKSKNNTSKINFKLPALLTSLTIVVLLPLQTGLDFRINTALVCAGYAMTYLICRKSNIGFNEVGLDPAKLKKSILPSLIIVFGLFVVLIGIYIIDPTIFRDRRYDQSLIDALIYAFVLLPFKTVVLEELIFRGVLLSALQRKYSFVIAASVSSLIFGMWHILPSLNVKSDALPTFLGDFARTALVIGIVIATFFAGLTLCFLRKKFDSLYVPIAAHWAINGSAIVLAYLAWN